MKLLNLNCQKGLHKNLKPFLSRLLNRGAHKILFLQEATDSVISTIKDQSLYNIVRHKTPGGESASVCLLHLKDVDCIESEYHHLDTTRENLYGMLVAVFKIKGREMITASIHLPAYLQPKKRRLALQKMKAAIKTFAEKHPKARQIIVAGDFNTILPWEHGRNILILHSIVRPIRNRRGYTYHSDRLEPDSISSSFVYALGKIGLSFKSTLDHVFANETLARYKRIKVYVLNKEVSDHLPMLIVVK